MILLELAGALVLGSVFAVLVNRRIDRQYLTDITEW